MKPKKSRRTTLWGTLAGLAAAYASFTPNPAHKAAAGGAAAFFTALLGLSARDHKVSSADAGLKSAVPITSLPDKGPRPTSGPLLAMIALLSLGPLSFTGCKILSKPDSLQNKAKAVAWGATTKLLQERPDWRPAFEIARDDLRILSLAETISLTEVMAIVNRLPIEKLQSGDAAIVIGVTMVFFEDELGSIALDKPDLLRAGVTGLYHGVDLALLQSPLPPLPP